MHIPVTIIKKIEWHPANEAPEAFKQLILWFDERPLIDIMMIVGLFFCICSIFVR
jgi:hypothetical protein